MNAKKLFSLGFALAIFSTAIACGAGDASNPDTINPDTSKQPAGGACTADDQCAAGLWCDTGLCIDPSDPVKPSQCEGTGCADGYECNTTDHQCYLKLQPVGPQLEQVCTTNADCGSGFHCESGACEPGTVIKNKCTSNADCQAGYICVTGDCSPSIPVPHFLQPNTTNISL